MSCPARTRSWLLRTALRRRDRPRATPSKNRLHTRALNLCALKCITERYHPASAPFRDSAGKAMGSCCQSDRTLHVVPTLTRPGLRPSLQRARAPSSGDISPLRQPSELLRWSRGVPRLAQGYARQDARTDRIRSDRTGPTKQCAEDRRRLLRAA